MSGSSQPASIFFDHITTSQGLSNNTVWTICKDRRGFLWLGTEDGLNRFDGKNFKVFRHSVKDKNSLPYNIIYRIREDDQGTLWVGTFNGACSINPTSDEITRYSYPANFDQTELTPIHDFGQNPKDHSIWVGSSKGLFWVNRKTEQLVPAKEGNKDHQLTKMNVIKMLWKDDDELWIAGRDDLYLYNSITGTHERFSIPNRNNEPTFVTSLHINNDGIWLGTWGRGIQHFDPVKKTFTRYLPRPELGERSDANIVYDISSTGDKNVLWIACNEPGFLAFNTSTKKFTPYAAKDKTDRFGVFSSAFTFCNDPKDGLWIGSATGLYRYDKSLQLFQSHSLQSQFNKYCLSQILNAYADPADSSGNTLFLSTWSCGTYRYNLSTRDVTKTPSWMQIKDEKRVTAFYRSSPEILWMGIKDAGLMRADEKNRSLKKFFFASGLDQDNSLPDINSIVSEGKKFWLGTSKGLYVFDTASGSFAPLFKSEFYTANKFSDYVSGLLKDHGGNIWFTTRLRSDHQCVIGKIRVGEQKPELFYYDPKQKNSMPEKRILNGITIDSRNNIYAATWDGIIQWNSKDQQPVFTWITTENGLSNNKVFEVSCDTNDRIWAATLKGISSFDSKSRVFRNYFIEDGIQDEKVEVFFRNPVNDQMIAAFEGSFDVVDTKAALVKSPPPIFISGLKVFNDPYSDNKKFMVDKGYADLKPDQNTITINFTSLEFANINQVKYAYKMEGLDKDWIITTSDFVTYNRLPHGKHKFLVKSCNAEGVWSKEPTWLDINLAPPFYKTAWFIGICIGLTFVILFLIYKIHIRRIEDKFRIRSTIARDLHDEIGSTLTSINILSRVSQSNLEKDKTKTSVMLNKITEQSQNMQQSMSDIIWAIKPENDKLKNLAARMREYLSHTLEAKEIKIEFEADEKVLEEHLTMEQRRDIFLIFKEAVNNAAKYSQTTSVQIELLKRKNQIILSITDRGKGFDTSLSRTTNGLKNMQTRAESLNARLEINSAPGKGTSVLLAIPRL